MDITVQEDNINNVESSKNYPQIQYKTVQMTIQFQLWQFQFQFLLLKLAI